MLVSVTPGMTDLLVSVVVPVIWPVVVWPHRAHTVRSMAATRRLERENIFPPEKMTASDHRHSISGTVNIQILYFNSFDSHCLLSEDCLCAGRLAMISLVNRQSLLGPFVALFAFPVSFWGSDVCGDARQQFQARSFRAAQSLLWACWEQQGSRPDPSIAYELAQTYRQLKNYRSGLDRLEATPDGRNLADRRYLQGYLRFRMGMFQESITALHEAFLYDPADWRVHQVFALNFVMLERRDAALHEFRTAIGLQPRNAELHYQLSRYLYVLNRFEEAIKEAQAALEIAPAYIDARTDLALCYEALGRDAAAEQEHRKAVDLASRASEKDEWPYINYGAWLARKGRYRESLPVLREATTIAPHSYEAWLLGGKAN